jgi:hypothetical protein
MWSSDQHKSLWGRGSAILPSVKHRFENRRMLHLSDRTRHLTGRVFRVASWDEKLFVEDQIATKQTTPCFFVPGAHSPAAPVHLLAAFVVHWLMQPEDVMRSWQGQLVRAASTTPPKSLLRSGERYYRFHTLGEKEVSQTDSTRPDPLAAAQLLAIHYQ